LSGRTASAPFAQDTSEAAPTDTAPIDRDYLARFTLGNAVLEREVLELFASQMPLYLRQLADARSRQAWRDATHAIKGSAAAVGARRLANVARMAEQLDIESGIAIAAGQRDKAMAAVREASAEACRYVACLFATP
jgi:HPt (histidine-containing phosphotransfer) domain-containing protein